MGTPQRRVERQYCALQSAQRTEVLQKRAYGGQTLRLETLYAVDFSPVWSVRPSQLQHLRAAAVEEVCLGREEEDEYQMSVKVSKIRGRLDYKKVLSHEL